MPVAMQPQSNPQALKAILFADLAQYSRLTAAGELAALDLVMRCFELFRDHCAHYRGEFIKTTGDGVFVVFDSVSDAIDYAMSVQAKLAGLAMELPHAGRFRIGLHLGDVRRRDGDVFGHAVNVAARVETQAEPGGLCVTEDVYRAARNTTRYVFRFAGRRVLKNIPGMVSLYHVTSPQNTGALPEPDHLSITVIDGLAIQTADGEPVEVRSRKAQALIGYLALSSGFRDLQQRIAALLWPDRPAGEARNALNQCLRQAGKALAGGPIEAELPRGNYAGIDPSRVIVDVIRILNDLTEGVIDESLLRRPDWPEAILYGFESVSSLYKAWLSVTRHNYRDRAQEALEDLLQRFDANEAVVKHAAAALLMLEPSHEGAVRCLMRHHSATHNNAAAMRVFAAFSATLRERYQLEPSTETAALAASLSGPVQLRERDRTPRDRPPVIAVGPFVSHGASIAALSSGFRSELIMNLSKFRELTVIDLREESGAPDVDYVFRAEGAEAEGGFRLFVSLEEPVARRIVWSDSYELSLAGWLSLQRKLVGRIAANVEVYLSHDRLARSLQELPENLGAYDAWLRGEHLLSHWSALSEDEAEKLFGQAIKEAPSFAPAHASLASVYNSRRFIRPGLPREPETQKRALELAGRAVELDPLDARNHMVVAWSAAMAQSFEQAELHYELACELNPNDPKIIVSAALGLAFMGRVDPAMNLLHHALTLTSLVPGYQWSHIATTRFLAGDYIGAVEAADRSQNLIVDTPGWKAAALNKLGRTGEGRAALAQLQQSVSIAWAGPSPPSRDDVLDWFLNAFPLRHESDKLSLAALLRLD